MVSQSRDQHGWLQVTFCPPATRWPERRVWLPRHQLGGERMGKCRLDQVWEEKARHAQLGLQQAPVLRHRKRLSGDVLLHFGMWKGLGRCPLAGGWSLDGWMETVTIHQKENPMLG